VVAFAIGGDEAAFSELVRRRQSGLRNLLRRLSRDPALTDDLAQQALLLRRGTRRGLRTLYPRWEYARLLDRARQMSLADRTPLLAALARNVAQVKHMLRNGGRVLSGTDAPIDFVAVSLTATRFPGEFLRRTARFLFAQPVTAATLEQNLACEESRQRA
jgi:hypothetical protein